MDIIINILALLCGIGIGWRTHVLHLRHKEPVIIYPRGVIGQTLSTSDTKEFDIQLEIKAIESTSDSVKISLTNVIIMQSHYDTHIIRAKIKALYEGRWVMKDSIVWIIEPTVTNRINTINSILK